MLRRLCLGLAVLAFQPLPAGAAGSCQLRQVGELKVRLEHNRPLIEVAVNGQKGYFLADTGAAYSLIWRSAAQRLKLAAVSTSGIHLYGAGGESRVDETYIRELSLGGSTVKNMRLLVSGEGEMGPRDLVGILGQDFFSQVDVELDLGHDAIRLLKPENCSGDQIVYWTQRYAMASMEAPSTYSLHYAVPVLLNGKRIEAHLDTGATSSVVTLAAAARAGVTPRSPGVVGKDTGRGLGGDVVTWLATFDSLAVGDEVIAKPKLSISDLFDRDKVVDTGSRIATEVSGMPSMLLGMDFLKAHRLLISNSQRRIYFTYNGGPVFEPGAAQAESKPAATATPAPQ